MAGQKQPRAFALQADALAMLEAAAERYQLPDAGKALRCLLDYAATDGDWDEIFSNVRCLRCGGGSGWTSNGSA